MNERYSINLHFSRAAQVYNEEAVLQRDIANSLCQRLPSYIQPERILDVGCGTGFLTDVIAKHFPESEIDALDISEAMLSTAATGMNGRVVDWLAGDAVAYQFPKKYDLIVSSSAIQWMLPLSKLFRNLRQALAPGGTLAFSLMIRGTLGELHSLRRELIPRKVPRAALPELNDVLSELQSAGFTINCSSTEQMTRKYEGASDFLHRIRALGFTGGAISTGEKPLTRGELRDLLHTYQSRFSNGSRSVFATYQVGYVEASL